MKQINLFLTFLFFLFAINSVSAVIVTYELPTPNNSSNVCSNNVLFNSSVSLVTEEVLDFSFNLDEEESLYCSDTGNNIANRSTCLFSITNFGMHKARAEVYYTKAKEINYDSNLTKGKNGGNTWNLTAGFMSASYNLNVLEDNNISTFYGLSGSNLSELIFNFSLTNISSVEIYWQPAPPSKTTNITGNPETYYFGYWNGSQWIYPVEWNSSENYQEFNKFYKISLTQPVETTKIKLIREVSSSGIAISELSVLSADKMNTTLMGEWRYFNMTNSSEDICTSPTFDFTPANVAINVGESFSVDFNATDDSPLTWSVNDTNFLIDENGTVTNNVTLSAGIYSILVTVTDAFNNSNSKVYELTVNTVTTSSSRGGGGRSRTIVNETIVQNVTAPTSNETVNSTVNETATDNAPKGFLPLTGAFIGTTTGKISVGIILFLIVLGGAYWFVAARRKLAKKK